MNRQIAGGCLGVLIVLGCNGKLQVDTEPPPSPHEGEVGEGGGSWNAGGAANEAGARHVAGWANVAGGGNLGAEGERCIRGDVHIEGEGTAAATEIRTLNRCSDGLTCDGDDRCVVMPDCADSPGGECVLYDLDAMAGAGGTSSGGGSGVAGAPQGWGGTAPGEIREEPRIRAIRADSERMYWLDYGTRDRLGNHQGDGALRAITLATRDITTIGADLPGPVAFGLTATHAYVSVDGGGVVGSIGRPSILRVPLEGGSPEVIDAEHFFGGEADVCHECFASHGTRAFWTTAGALVSMTADDDSPTIVLDAFGSQLAADETHLYYVSSSGSGVLRIPHEGGTPEAVAEQAWIFALQGSHAYGVERIEDDRALVLDRLDETRGVWTRLRGLGTGGFGARLLFVGDRFFFDAANPSGSSDFSVLTGSLASEGALARMLERPSDFWRSRALWSGTADSLLWSDGERIYSVPIPTED